MRGSIGGVWRSTTVVGVVRDGQLALGADGQVTVGDTALKHGARKVRSSAEGRVAMAFAGGAADGLALSERLEAQLDAHSQNLRRAAVELAKEWRGDRVLRRLDAMLLVGDPSALLIVSGNGDVLEPDDGVAAVGSGGAYALAAARALLRATPLAAPTVVRAALGIAAELCIYTNDHIEIVTLPETEESAASPGGPA